jgi:HEAT repeat protein/Tfp pilus assembly protein PilF
LFCLLFLTLTPDSSGQQLTAADVPVLVRQLKDKHARVRAEAARHLTSLGVEARDALPALIQGLRDSDAKVRYRCVIALGGLWSGAESGPDIEVAVPLLVELLKKKDEDVYTRLRAVDALRMLGTGARAALPSLNELVRDKKDPIRINALVAIMAVERPKPTEVPEVIRQLKDKDARVRAEAARRLDLFGPLAKPSAELLAAIPALVEALRDPEAGVRKHCVSVLVNLSFWAERMDMDAGVPALVEMLKEADDFMRREAAMVLGKVGPGARDAVPALTQALDDRAEKVRSAAAYALGEIGRESKEAAPFLVKLLKDSSADVRESAGKALSKVEPDASGVVIRALTEDLKNEKPAFRARAARALRSFGPEAKAAVPLLVDVLKAEDVWSRKEASRTLGEIGPAAKEAVPALLRSLNERDVDARVSAAAALLRVAPESEAKLTPKLLEYAKARIEWNEKERAGNVSPGIAIPPEPETNKWAEARDYVNRGYSSEQQGDLYPAVAFYTKAIEIDPRYADAYRRRGLIHRARGSHDYALADFTKAIEVDDERAGAYYYSRGATYMNKGDYDAAVADFTEAIKRNDYNADAYYARGAAYHWKGNYDAAIRDYDRALEFIPPAVLAFGSRGRAKLAQGKIEDALADLDEAIKLDPKNAANHQGRGDALKAQERFAPAEDSYREALRLSPDDPAVLGHIGHFLVEQNKSLKEALKLIERAVKAQPANPSFLHSFGWAYLKLGRLEEAERYLSESVRHAAMSAIAQEHLGDVYARRGDMLQAQAAWGKALSLSSAADATARLKAKLSGSVKE